MAIVLKVVDLDPEVFKKTVATLEDKKLDEKTKKRSKIEVIVEEIGHSLLRNLIRWDVSD